MSKRQPPVSSLSSMTRQHSARNCDRRDIVEKAVKRWSGNLANSRGGCVRKPDARALAPFVLDFFEQIAKTATHMLLFNNIVFAFKSLGLGAHKSFVDKLAEILARTRAPTFATECLRSQRCHGDLEIVATQAGVFGLLGFEIDYSQLNPNDLMGLFFNHRCGKEGQRMFACLMDTDVSRSSRDHIISEKKIFCDCGGKESKKCERKLRDVIERFGVRVDLDSSVDVKTHMRTISLLGFQRARYVENAEFAKTRSRLAMTHAIIKLMTSAHLKHMFSTRHIARLF